MELPARFWSKVDKDPMTGCWNWTAAINVAGYGVFGMGGLSTGAHRFSYQEAHGAIPKKYTVDHLCRNRRCVNPAHLQLVSIGENLRRGDTIVSNYAKRVAGATKPKRHDLRERLANVKAWFKERHIQHYGAVVMALYPEVAPHRQRMSLLWIGNHHPSDGDEQIIELLERSIKTIKNVA